MTKQVMVPSTTAFPLAHLHEPIYNEAVHDPEDILYEGSDDEEYNSPSEKRIRYEKAGWSYLSGRELFLLSASLKGPFDNKSGWVNPWQSQGRKQGRVKSKPHQPLSKSSREIAESPVQLKPIPDDCTRCHLPSPESLSQEPVSDTHQYMDEDELARVEQWRGDVSQIEACKSSFWTSAEENISKSTRKRRAKGSAWLRRLPTKKMRMQNEFEDDGSTPSTQASSTRRSDGALDRTPTRRKRQHAQYKPVVHGRKLVSPGQTGDSEDELSMVNIVVPRAVARRMTAEVDELAVAAANDPSISYFRVLEVAQSGLPEPHWRGIVEAKNLCAQAIILDTNRQTVGRVSQDPICVYEGEDVREDENATVSSEKGTALSVPNRIASTLAAPQDESFYLKMSQRIDRTPNKSPATNVLPEELGPTQCAESLKNGNLSDGHKACGGRGSGVARSGLLGHATEVGNPDSKTQIDLEQPVTSEATKWPTASGPVADEKRPDSQGACYLKAAVQPICLQSPRAAVTQPASPSRPSSQAVPGPNGSSSEDHDKQATVGDKISQSSSVNNYFGANSPPGTPEKGVHQVNEIPGLLDQLTPGLSRIGESQCPRAALHSPVSHLLANTPRFTPSSKPCLQQPTSSVRQRQSPDATFDQPNASSSLPPAVPGLQRGQSLRPDIWPQVLQDVTAPNQSLPLIPSPHINDRAGESMPHFSHHMTRSISSMKEIGVQSPGAQPANMEASQDSRVPSQLQTPWAKGQTGITTTLEATVTSKMRETPTVLDGRAVVDTSVAIPAEQQSPWDSTNQNIQSMTKQVPKATITGLNEQNTPLGPTRMVPKTETRSADTDSQASSANCPSEQRSPFDLLLFSPERPRRKRRRGGTKGNLKVAPVNDDVALGRSSMSRPRVSFAPLPHESGDSEADAAFTKRGKAADYSSMMESLSLRGSPPPEIPLDEIPDGERQHFSKHFEAITKRANDSASHQRILPTRTQQIPESPEMDAMANAFIAADSMQKEKHGHEKSVYSVTSPYEEDEPLDDAEEVLNNLEEYLGAPWDINKALEEEEKAFHANH